MDNEKSTRIKGSYPVPSIQNLVSSIHYPFNSRPLIKKLPAMEEYWGNQWGSNPRPSESQSDALTNWAMATINERQK